VALTTLDASVLIALLDPADTHHQSARTALEAHADDDLRIAAHTLAEALVHPARAGKEQAARRLIGTLEITVDPIDEQVAVAAARLRAKHGSALRMPDALVLAHADHRKAKTVLTADARWSAWSPRVELLGG
jgi:predicted nucleic acid-binding protein